MVRTLISSSMGALGEEELAQELINVGNRLLSPQISKDELLHLLDHAEIYLSKVEQAPSDLVKDSLVPAMVALSAKELLKNPDTGVKVSTLSCIAEITRISAPDAPFDDSVMKDIFELTVATFEKLSNTDGRCYLKAVSVLANVARMRLCVVMLDLECEELIIKMFQTFLNVIRSNHTLEIFSFMEAIMTVTIEESEEISLDLLSTLLASVRKENQVSLYKGKENQNISSASWKLGNQVIENCAGTLKPYLIDAVRSKSIIVGDYSPLVISLCQNTSDLLMHNANVPVKQSEGTNNPELVPDMDLHSQVEKEPVQNGSGVIAKNVESIESKETAKSESQVENIPLKRGRKPNSLMKPDEGYDNSWVGSERRDLQKRRIQSKNSFSKRQPEENIDFSSEIAQSEIANLVPDKSSSQINQFKKKKHISDNEIVEVDCDDKSVVKGKQRRRQRKNALEVKTEVNVTSHVDAILENKSENPLSKQSDANKKESFVQTDTKKLSRVKSDSRDSAEGSYEKVMDCKSTMLSKAHEINMNGSSPQMKVKRKRTPGKEETSRRTDNIIDLDEKLVGHWVKVWWPMDKRFYIGVVNSFDPLTKKHMVIYKDGDEEILDFSKELWHPISNGRSQDEDKETDHLSPIASSSMRRKKTGNVKSAEQSGKKLPSSKKRAASSTNSGKSS